MMQTFPYEDYRAAIEAESGRRAVGLEATVLAVEGDDSREDCFVLGLSFNGRLDESLYENGSIAVDVATFAIDDACTRCGRPLSGGELVRYTQTLTNPEEYGRRRHLMEYTQLLRKLSAKQREVEKRLAKERALLSQTERGNALYAESLQRVSDIVDEARKIGQQRKEEVAAMLAGAKIVCCTVTSCLYNDFASGDFDVVLVDEASQISLAVWPCLMNKAGGRKFVVAGDPMQLSPVQSRDTDIGTRYWFDQSIYAYLGMTTFRGIEPFYDIGAMILLNEQSRMRKGICEIVSKMFYNGLLVGGRNDAPISLSSAGLPDGDVVVIDADDSEELHGFDRLPQSRLPKNVNLASAGMVTKAIREIVRTNPPGRRIDILVVSPFRDQAKKVYSSRIKTLELGDDVTVRVSTVHSCQGGEADIVFFDLVNPLSGFLRNEDAAHLWCVACSRARQKLVVVGSVDAMLSGRYSAALLAASGYFFGKGHRSDLARPGIRAGSKADWKRAVPVIRRFGGSPAWKTAGFSAAVTPFRLFHPEGNGAHGYAQCVNG